MTRVKDNPATYGGVGWRPRERSHQEELEAGIVWRHCGSRSEVASLLEVLLAWPTTEMFPDGEPNDFLFLEWPNVARLQQQARAVAALYQSHGVAVHWIPVNPALLPNFLFQRDLFFMTPEGAVLARPGSRQRAGEARFTAAALAELGIPILATPRGHAIFEGADALWLDEQTVMIGCGLRTNEAGTSFVAGLLSEMNINSVSVKLPDGVQHLLGIINFVDEKLAAVRQDKMTDELLGILRDARVKVIECEPGPEITERLGMNFVAVSPRQVVMPGDCPSVRDSLAKAGVLAHEVDVSEYCKAAGGLGCLTGIIRRQASIKPGDV
jgi:N-dimethylarginine dimethylaminohydrolase